MALDDNSLNNIGHHPDPPVWPSGAENKVFPTSGAPAFDGTTPGDAALDTDTGDIYEWNGAVWTLSFTGGGGGGGASEPPVLHVIGSGNPVGVPASYERVAYNDAGKIWLNVDSIWQLRLE